MPNSATFSSTSVTVPATSTSGTLGTKVSISVTIEKELSGTEVIDGEVTVKLVDADWIADDILDKFTYTLPKLHKGVYTKGKLVKFVATFYIYDNGKGAVAGAGASSGESSAELRIEFNNSKDNYGSCSAEVV